MTNYSVWFVPQVAYDHLTHVDNRIEGCQSLMGERVRQQDLIVAGQLFLAIDDCLRLLQDFKHYKLLLFDTRYLLQTDFKYFIRFFGQIFIIHLL